MPRYQVQVFVEFEAENIYEATLRAKQLVNQVGGVSSYTTETLASEAQDGG